MNDSNEQPQDVSYWIREALRVCHAASRGDLEQRITRIACDGEMGELLHAMNHLLDMTDAFVREATAALEHASRGEFYRRVLPEGMLGSFRQAAESINAATQQMDVKTRDLSAAEARRLQLADDFGQTRKTVETLAAASKQIGGFSKVIHSIASQTNLLALNATIESARVGEAGRGFAVVAGEVKRLARQTSDATAQIESQVRSIQAASKQTSDAVEKVCRTLSSQDNARVAA